MEQGPHIQFSPHAIQSWSARTGLDDLDKEEVEASYRLNVSPYLMVQKDLLVTKYGWIEGPKADVCSFPFVLFTMKPNKVTVSGRTLPPLAQQR